MMRKLSLLFAALQVATSLYAQDFDIKAQYERLDQAISNSDVYVQRLNHSVDSLRGRLATVKDDRQRYALLASLYQSYKAFDNDSALHYAGECVVLAEQMGNKSLAGLSRAVFAHQCSSSGMFQEGIELLGKIHEEDLDSVALANYYCSSAHLYGELAYYTKLPYLQQDYYAKSDFYWNKLSAMATAENDTLLQHQEQLAMNGNKFDEALRINDHRLRHVEKGTHAYAVVSFYRYLDYQKQENEDMAEYWLTESAIADVENAVRDQGSLWELANMLHAKGDLERSYRYISFASDCANHFGTRVRTMQISTILQDIEKNYQEQTESQKHRLRWLLALISVLAVGVLLSLFSVLRQRKRLQKAYNELEISHRQLKELGAQMEDANRQLTALNGDITEKNGLLASVNQELSESNRVKEEYVGRFLQMCSHYVDRMEDMRKYVNRKLKNREFEALYKETKTQDQKERDVEELLEQFDKSFLKLYPNFVEKFNSLLKPEERIEQPGRERLTTGLRIFALIRLGIDESSKIAEFLHYSVNTIYNYRAKIKNAAIRDRENFESQVKTIDM